MNRIIIQLASWSMPGFASKKKSVLSISFVSDTIQIFRQKLLDEKLFCRNFFLLHKSKKKIKIEKQKNCDENTSN